MMGSPKAGQNGGLRAVILTAVMLLALAPMSPVHANDSEGELTNLQAQNIQAVFDNTSETTLITWDNIATGGSELNGAARVASIGALRLVRGAVRRRAGFDIYDVDIERHARECACPTLVLCALDDALVPPAHSHAVHAALPHAELCVCPGTHNSVRPRGVSQRVERFLREHVFGEAQASSSDVEGLLDELVDQGLGRRLQQLLFGAAPSSEVRGAVSVTHTDDINENVEVPLSGLTADLDVFAEAVVAERAPSPPVVSTGNSRAIAAALAETESSVREPLLLPGEVVHVDRLATGPVAFTATAGDYERLLLSNALLGHHLPAGYCDLLLELSGAYASDESSDALAALRARVIASDWARPVDRSVLT